ncbi:MAG: GNAT family N-acetyltransferase [Anaerolineae bacterium]|nr:GNAT family N-acetyltransferase [Anaerolineae bacterium]
MITLKPITKENWHAAIRLEVAPEQRKFVASNVYSIAESHFEPGAVPMGIYNEVDTMIGFLMYGPYHGEMWIWRLMVDQRYQQRGYGRAAMQAIVAALRAMGHTEIFLSHEPENTVGAEFYTSLGFEDTGRIDGGELVRRLRSKE